MNILILRLMLTSASLIARVILLVGLPIQLCKIKEWAQLCPCQTNTFCVLCRALF